jgi:hypothetical protein
MRIVAIKEETVCLRCNLPPDWDWGATSIRANLF